jgi:hypothetical protein
MRNTLIAALSILALVALLVGSILHVMGIVSATTSQHAMTVGTAGWFLTAPLWMRRKGSTHQTAS